GETAPTDPTDTDFTAFHLLHLAPGSDLASALERLRALPEVASADPIAVLPVSALPNDSLTFAAYWLYKEQAVRTDIRAPEAWQLESGDTNIVVGIIDTGVIPYHPDLGGVAGERGNLYVNWAERGGVPGVDDDANGYIDDFSGWDFVAAGTLAAAGEDARNEDNDPNDYGGHGTAVAGIVGAIAGNGIGLAGVVPNVRMMSLRIGWLQSGGLPPAGNVDMSYAAAAIRYATRMGVSVVNCSWQSQNTGGLDAAVSAATRAGMVIVDASGNFGTGFTYLGTRDDVIAVTATDSTDVVWVNAVRGPWVDLAAAGVIMTSTMIQRLSTTDSLTSRTPTYRSFINGTSFAAPQVAGAVALVQAQRRRAGLDPLTPVGMNLRLRETSDDISAQNPLITDYGKGRLNLLRALTDPARSLAVHTRARSLGAPVVLHYNTGRTVVVYAMSDRTLLAFDGATGDTLWSRALPAPLTGQLAAADFGLPVGVLIVAGTSTGSVFAVHDDGRIAEGWPQVALAGANMNAGALVTDVDGDGVPDIVAGGSNIGTGRMFAWNAAGVPLAGFPFDAGPPGLSVPAAADLDGVAGDELAFLDGAFMLHVVGAGGAELAGFPAGPFPSARAPVIARDPVAAPALNILLASSTLDAVATDGTLRWSVPLAGPASQDPALGTLAADLPECIVVAVGGAGAGLEVRDLAGAPLSSRPGWPLTLAAPVVGPPVIAPLGSVAGAQDIGYFQSTGFRVLDSFAQANPRFPLFGVAGIAPAVDDLDGDGASEVAAGVSVVDSLAYTFDAGALTWHPDAALWATPRGDMARTASHANGTPVQTIDRIRPAMVTTLQASALSTIAARVRWNVTGDDSLNGTAAQVELRRARFPLDDATFANGISVPVPAPGAPGALGTLDVIGLPEGSTWWFAVRVRDRAGNRSAVSNSDSAQVPGLAPAAITDLRAVAVDESTVVLTWTATGDDGSEGRPQSYRIAGSTQVFDDDSFEGAPIQLRRPAFVDAGGAETLQVTRVAAARRWYFAVRAIDRALTDSPLSNLAQVFTPVGDSELAPAVPLRANVTALSGLGNLITGALVLVVLTWWVRHVRISRRNRAAAKAAARHPGRKVTTAKELALTHELSPDAATSTLPPS
ncbi:MAG: S8 family serine peptidase, partial [Candidatus Eisenbacteria bacterium]